MLNAWQAATRYLADIPTRDVFGLAMLPLKQILFQGRPVSREAELLYTWLRTRRSLAEAELPAAVHFDTPRSKGGPPGALDLIDFLNKQEGARDAEQRDVQERCACLMLCNAGQVKQFMKK